MMQRVVGSNERVSETAEATTDLSVVVLSLGAPGDLVGAVGSLLRQSVLVEIVVVNSGGGSARNLLGDVGPNVQVLNYEERHFAGAARNIGIRAARGKYVAFLASDCRATPNWAEARLRVHRQGVPAVGSAVLPSDPQSIVAWASHLSLFARRLPRTPRVLALPYGASYNRSLFEEFGYFREDLRTGEDTEFHARLPVRQRPLWSPAVQTIHKSPTSLRKMLQDQFSRGSRAAVAWAQISGRPPVSVARTWWRRTWDPILISQIAAPAENAARVRIAWALLPIAAAAYCVGALCSAKRG